MKGFKKFLVAVAFLASIAAIVALLYSKFKSTVDADDFDDSVLSDIEKANRDFIVEYEKENGYNQ